MSEERPTNTIPPVSAANPMTTLPTPERIEEIRQDIGKISRGHEAELLQALDTAQAENTRLREALEQCGAEYRSPQCTMNEGFMYLCGEFERRIEVARAALTKESA